MIRVLSLILVLLLLLPIDFALSENVGSSLTVGIQSTKTLTIRPFEPLERDMLSVYNEIYESMIVIDDNYLPQGCLAESWEESSNGKLWTFHLRTDIRFSDGSPLTAHDVVASAKYILDKANDENTTDHGFYSNLRFFVDSISAKDDHTVVVKAKSANGRARTNFGILYEMTFPVVPASQVNMDNPLGSGPYVVSSFVAGDYMTLEANQNWWKTQPSVRQLMFSFHDTPSSVIESYEYNRVDAIFTRSLASSQYKTGTLSVTMSYRTAQLECLLMNNSNSIMTPEIRKAIRYVIDRKKIINSIYSGLAVETNFPFFPGTWMYNESLDSQFTINVEEAKRLLESAGWEDLDDNGVLERVLPDGTYKNLNIKLFVYEEPDNDVRLETANLIAEWLSEIGINCKVEPMTMANVAEKLSAGSFDLALVSFSLDVCPDPGFLMIAGNTGNYCRYKSEKMTELYNQLRKKTTQEEYRQTLMEIQARFAEDCPFMCLYFRMGNVISRYMYTTCRDVREYELLRGIESFTP